MMGPRVLRRWTKTPCVGVLTTAAPPQPEDPHSLPCRHFNSGIMMPLPCNVAPLLLPEKLLTGLPLEISGLLELKKGHILVSLVCLWPLGFAGLDATSRSFPHGKLVPSGGEHVPCDPKHEALSLVGLKLRIFSGCGSFRATKGQVLLLSLGPDFLPPSAGDDCHTKA